MKSLRPHNDPEYRRAKALLKANPTDCRLGLDGCTGTATTLDHQPRLDQHAHVRGARCCTLVPACFHCNSSDGATYRNAKLYTPATTGYDWP